MRIWEADEFVKVFHRHNKEAGNGKFAIGCVSESGELIGVAIAGRPRSRHLDNGITLEVYRVCVAPDEFCAFTNKNATSYLYSKVKRISQQMGYQKVLTYTLQSESGSSLRAIQAEIVFYSEHDKQWNDHGDTKRSVQEVTILPKYRWEL